MPLPPSALSFLPECRANALQLRSISLERSYVICALFSAMASDMLEMEADWTLTGVARQRVAMVSAQGQAISRILST